MNCAEWSTDVAQLKEVSPGSRVCHRIQRRERVKSVEALMTALTQKLVPDVIEANSILFQLCSRGDMLSSGATRNSGMEITQSVMTLTTCEHQVD